MLASKLEKFDFLISPNFSYPNAQRSVLNKYRENSIKIAKSAVLAITKPKNPNQPINEHIFKWVIQACGYALRINDQKNEDSFFQQSLILYLDWLTKFPFTCDLSLRESYIRIMMLHLTQVFVNPSFNEFICFLFMNKIKMAFTTLKEQLSSETWTVILKVLFYGNLEILKLQFMNNEEPAKLEFAKTTLDILYKCDIYPDDNFWSQFDDQLSELFKYQIFCSAWLSKFSELYILRLKRQKDGHITKEQLNYLNYIIQFYRKKIDTEFDEINKQEAFTTIVYSWSIFTQEGTSLLHRNWNIDEIKEMILPWFSLNVEWKRDETMNVTHPLFLLIKMGEGQLSHQKDDQLESIASQIIKKALSSKIKNDLYWFFPQYSYFFLVKNPKLLNEIKDDIIEYVKNFKDSEYTKDAELNIYICFILMLLIERNQYDPRMINSLSQFIATNMNDFQVFLVSFICLLLIKNSELFWSMYNICLANHEFDDVIDILSIISCYSPHLNGSEFVNNLTINNRIWNFLYEPLSNFYRQRLILALFFLSEGSDYFAVNPEDGASLIQYFIAKDGDSQKVPGLSNFFNMARLSILCGGALNANKTVTNDAQPTKTVENFLTKSYVVSVMSDNHLKIRHGLGETIFLVDDSSNFFNASEKDDQKSYIPKALKEDTTFSEESTTYVSNCEPSAELFEAVERMDSLFVSNSDFEPYVPPTKEATASAAHAFLCDTGFISSFSEKNIRRVNLLTMQNTIEAKLDKIEPTPTIKIPIIQVDENSEIFSRNSDAIQKLVEIDLKNAQTKVCKLEFAYATNILSLIEMIEKYGFCLLFNETGKFLNHGCKDVKANVIISLTPDNDHYIIDMMFSKNLELIAPTARRKIFGNREFNDFSFVVPNEMIANFISLIAVIYYNSSPSITSDDNENILDSISTTDGAIGFKQNDRDNELQNSSQQPINSPSYSHLSPDSNKEEKIDEQIMGPELFVSGFKKRMIAISNEFDKTNQGKMPLLIEISQES